MQPQPFEISATAAYPSKPAWDATAAELVAAMLRRWRLSALDAFVGGEAAAVLAVRTADGRDAVLKVGYPHVEAVHEAVALAAWAPELAPTVLRQDPWTWAMLLERVAPGVPLSRAGIHPDSAVDAAARLFVRLSAVAPPAGLPSLSDMMLPFVQRAEPHDELTAAGLRRYRELLATHTPARLLHGDYNPGNVLQDGTGWRVIDPKPMVGDPAFDLAPLVDEVGSPWSGPHPERIVSERMSRAAALAGCDPERAVGWAFARAALDHCWYTVDGEREAAAAAHRRAAGWRSISGS